jgi:hypothetical protein
MYSYVILMEETVTVPVKDPEIGPGLLSDVMNQIQMDREEFIMLLQNPKKWRKAKEKELRNNLSP